MSTGKQTYYIYNISQNWSEVGRQVKKSVSLSDQSNNRVVCDLIYYSCQYFLVLGRSKCNSSFDAE